MTARDLSGVTCVGYCRVSTEQQAGESRTSIPDQQAAITAKAEQAGLVVGAWFVDGGASGATVDKRPALRALLASCEAHPRPDAGAVVLCLNDSRFGRFPDPEEATYWRHHLKRYGWVVRFVEGDDVEDEMGRGVLRFVGQAQATQYRRAIVANARRGAKGTTEQGYWRTREPFGYRRQVVYPPDRTRILPVGSPKASDEKIKLVPHAEEAAIVRDAFTRFAAGETLGTLSHWLRSVAPSRTWRRSAVHGFLTNPAYLGHVVSGRRASYGKGVGVEHAHPALVDAETFAAVQARLVSNKKHRRGAAGPYLLSGLVRCAQCGDYYVGGGAGGWLKRQPGQRLWFYRERWVDPVSDQREARRCTAKGGTIAKHRLEGAVLDTLSRHFASRRVRATIAREVVRVAEARATATDEPLARMQAGLAGLHQQRTRLVAAIASGVLTTEDAAPQMLAIRTALAEREREVEAVQAQRARGPSAEWVARVLQTASDFPALLAKATPRLARDLITPWLKSATFDKETRVLTMEIRRVPSLQSSGWPGPDGQDTRCWTKRVRLVAGMRGWWRVE